MVVWSRICEWLGLGNRRSSVAELIHRLNRSRHSKTKKKAIVAAALGAAVYTILWVRNDAYWNMNVLLPGSIVYRI